MNLPDTEPGPQPPIVLAVIARPRGVLVVRRHDGDPLWSFPGGTVQPEEPMSDAVRRLVAAETGLQVQTGHILGTRVHPRTGREAIYFAVTVADGEPVLGDPDDLAEVRWASHAETRLTIPDMFSAAREYLESCEEASER